MKYKKPVAINELSEEELKAELRKGYESAMQGNNLSADESERLIKEEFGI